MHYGMVALNECNKSLIYIPTYLEFTDSEGVGFLMGVEITIFEVTVVTLVVRNTAVVACPVLVTENVELLVNVVAIVSIVSAILVLLFKVVFSLRLG